MLQLSTLQRGFVQVSLSFSPRRAIQMRGEPPSCLGSLKLWDALNVPPPAIRCRADQHGYLRVHGGNVRVPQFLLFNIILLAVMLIGYERQRLYSLTDKISLEIEV